MSLQLWIANKNYSSWSLRPWFLLKALNIPFDEQLATFVPGGSSYEKFLRFSPSGLVPCLVTADTTVWDSLAICEYIAEDYPHVWPQEKTARAWARSAAAEMHSGFTTLRRECPLNCSESRPAAEMTPELQKECQRLDKIWCEGLTGSVARGWQGKYQCGGCFLCAGGPAGTDLSAAVFSGGTDMD